ncbi:ribose 5-phosphate isomerase B [Ruminococcaceae bacterium OttesenSCG-928-L11]|nr:ribose 5-phosphate isomerase B [Ruminococcaceae bacterium OttesenSCG-928-L11]
MKVALGADSAGYALKEEIKAFLDEKGIAHQDFGAYNEESSDYPLMATGPCRAVTEGDCECAILICGTGIGISMAANKVKGIRAAVCGDYFSAKYTRLHNDANVLCLGGRVIGRGLALELVDVFLSTGFEGGRHARRVGQIHDIENGLL